MTLAEQDCNTCMTITLCETNCKTFDDPLSQHLFALGEICRGVSSIVSYFISKEYGTEETSRRSGSANMLTSHGSLCCSGRIDTDEYKLQHKKRK